MTLNRQPCGYKTEQLQASTVLPALVPTSCSFKNKNKIKNNLLTRYMLKVSYEHIFNLADMVSHTCTQIQDVLR